MPQPFIQFDLEQQHLGPRPYLNAVIAATRHNQPMVGFVVDGKNLSLVVNRVHVLPNIQILFTVDMRNLEDPPREHQSKMIVKTTNKLQRVAAMDR
jgi:hypothetical protein